MNFFSRFRTRAAAPVIALCLALIASGCIVYEEQITFDAAGAGTLELTCGIDLSAIESLGLPGEMGGMGGMESSEEDSEDESEDTCGRSTWALLPTGAATVVDFTESVDGKPMQGIRVS